MYLTDDPIKSEEDDSFGHKEYVDTLAEIIQNVEPPWHVGIFGEWGSGKSSIINLLYNRIRSESEYDDVLCIEFDAWAHAEDSIRTELLLELDRRIGEEVNGEGSDGVLGEEEITGRLYDVEEEEQIAKSNNPKAAVQNFWEDSPLLVLAFLGIGVLAALLEYGGHSAIASVFVTALLLPVLGYILQQLDSVTQTIQRKFLYPRKEWTGAYQRIFDSVVDEAEAEKVVISVDNLDRCESGTVYEVLVSLKTFLEDERCIYLIPCDDEALESHLDAISEDGYFGDTRSERKFLRKFFQTHIRIPPFQSEDVEQYAQEQNKELVDEFDPEEIDIVANAYFENPRRIKHAINRLVTIRSIAREREDDQILNENRITGNIPFLAKISILEEEFPGFFKQLVEDPYLLEDINSYFNNELEDSEKKNRAEAILDADERGESRLESFLSSTQRVTAPDVRPFLNLSEQPYSSGLEDLDRVLRYLKTGQEAELRNQIKNIHEKDNSFVQYCNAIQEELRTYRANGRSQPMYAIISSLIAVYDEFDANEETSVARIIGDYLTSDPGRENIKYLDAGAALPAIIQMPKRHSRILFDAFAERVAGDGALQEGVLTAFIDHAKEVPSHAVETLSDNIVELEEAKLGDGLRMLGNSDSAKEHLVTPDIINRSVALLDIDNSKDEFVQTAGFGRFDDIAGPEERSLYVDRLLHLRDEYSGNQAQKLDESLSQHLLAVNNQLTQSGAATVFSSIKELIETQNNEDLDLVEACMHFYDSFSEDTKSEFDQWVSNLFNQWNPQNAQKLIELAEGSDVDVLHTESQVEAFFSRIPGHIDNNDFIVNEAIPRIPAEFDSNIVDLTRNLVRNNNNNVREICLAIIEEHPNRLKGSFGSIIDQCGNQMNREGNSNVKQQLLMPIAIHFSKLSGPEQENLIGQMENLLSRDAGDYRAYNALWKEFEADADADRRAAVVADVREEVVQQINNGQNPDHLTPLIEILQSMPDELADNQGSQLMERLSNRLTDRNLNANQYSIVIEQLAGFGQFYGKESQVLDRVEDVLSKQDNNKVKNAAKQLLDKLEKVGDVDDARLDEVRERYIE